MKLYLAKQCDTSRMPPFIVGKLMVNEPAGFTLSNVLSMVADPHTVSGFRVEENKFFDVINRTYVYRVEILGGKPDLTPEEVYEGEEYEGGGLG